MPSRMHLISFLMHGPINHSINSWTEPGDNRLEAMGSYAAWQDLARTLERGCFDAVFFADTPGVFDRYRERPDDALRYGVCWPCHDPMMLVPVMAAVTKNLGFAVTKSVSGVPPYALVRELSTFDYLSGGRCGWNVVTGILRGEHRALGSPLMAHDERYDRADEYMEICRKLWSGIKPGSIVIDKERGIFADPDKIELVAHDGRYFQCHTPPPVMPSAQGHPVIFQAGSSGRGQRFAVEHAEVMFSIQPHLEGMKRYIASVNAAAQQYGRVDPVRVTFGLQVILGGTEEEARRNQKRIAERIPIDAALSRLSGSLGVDFSVYELDRPLEEMATDTSQGMMQAMTAMVGGGRRMTLREVAMHWASSVGMKNVVGTPEQAADELELLWRETGCFGFNISPTVNNGSVIDFVDQVVPILQRKGVFRKAYAATTLRGNLLDDGSE